MVEWQIGLSTCGDVNVDSFQMKLVNERGEVISSEEVDCNLTGDKPKQTHTLLRITPGTYRVEVNGFVALENNGKKTKLLTYTGSYPEDVNDKKNYIKVVSSQRATLKTPIRVSALPGGVYLNWSFENGKLCFPNKVDKVRVVITDAFGNEVQDKQYPCDLSQLVTTDTKNQSSTDFLTCSSTNSSYVEEVNALCIGGLNSGRIDVELEGLNATGTKIFEGYIRIENLVAGQYQTLDIVLKSL